MKKIIALVFLFTVAVSSAQKIEPTYKIAGDLVKATYYYDNGSVKEEGFFKNKKLTGKWVSYDKQGEKKLIAYYNNGKKIGKWFVWNNETLKEVNYNNNAIVSVKNWSQDTRLASNEK